MFDRRVHPLMIYVACSSKHWDIARSVMDKIEKASHTVTVDWTTVVDEESKMSSDELRGRVIKACNMIASSDGIIFIPTGDKSSGTFFEIGYGLSRNKDIVIADIFDTKISHFFLNHPKCKFVSSIDEAITYLEEKGL
jgi:hypothetical protein